MARRARWLVLGLLTEASSVAVADSVFAAWRRRAAVLFAAVLLSAVCADTAATEARAQVDPLDIEVTGVEVNQSVQDVANTVPLVAGKPTMVLVHTTANRNVSITSDGGVVGTLHLSRSDGSNWTPLRSRPTNVFSPAERKDGVLFQLPAGWRRPGIVTLRGEVQSVLPLGETNLANNSFSVTVRFRRVRTLKLHVVNVSYVVEGERLTPSPGGADAIRSKVLRMFPVAVEMTSSLLLYNCPDQVNITHPCKNTFNPDDPRPHKHVPNVLMINSRIAAYRYKREGTSREPLYVGLFMTPRGYEFSGPLGVASFSDATAAVRSDLYAGFPGLDSPYDNFRRENIAAHEIGHLLHMDHTSGCSATDAVDQFPGGIIGGPADDPTRYLGWDVGHPARGEPSNLLDGPVYHDVMTYCDNVWISPQTYSDIARRYLLPNIPGVGRAHAVTK